LENNSKEPGDGGIAGEGVSSTNGVAARSSAYFNIPEQSAKSSVYILQFHSPVLHCEMLVAVGVAVTVTVLVGGGGGGEGG